jgi:hypothetical protein
VHSDTIHAASEGHASHNESGEDSCFFHCLSLSCFDSLVRIGV